MEIKVLVYRHSRDIPSFAHDNNLFHSTQLFNICEQTPGYTPILAVAYQGEKPIGRLLGIIRKSVRYFPPSLIRRCEVYGPGEYADPTQQEEVFAHLLWALTQTAIRHCFLLEFRNLENPMFAYRHFRQNQYFPMNWLRIHNSLHSKHPEERLSASRRRQIRQALDSGATYEVARSREDIESFLHLLQKYYASKIRKHFPGLAFFRRLLEENTEKEVGRIFIVKYKGHIIGGSVCVFSKDNAYLWFSGGLRKSYPRQYPGVLAVWAALMYAYEHGYAHMEFMDVGLSFRPYGYRDFVIRFGGIQYATRRWFKFRWNWLNKLFTRLYI